MRKLLFIFLLLGCGSSVNEPEIPSLEIKHWGTIASRNRLSSYPPWNHLSGLQAAYYLRNTGDVDLEIEYSLQIWGARSQSDTQNLIPIGKSVLLSSTLGVISEATTPNYDPIRIREDNIIPAQGEGYAIAFAEINWDVWWSVWSTVSIHPRNAGLSKTTTMEIGINND